MFLLSAGTWLVASCLALATLPSAQSEHREGIVRHGNVDASLSTMTSIDVNELDKTSGSFGVQSEYENELLGMRVALIGDYNGDGLTDFVVGAPQASRNGFTNCGEITVILGQSGGLNTSFRLDFVSGPAGFRITGGGDDDMFGTMISSAGDFNNDGYSDILIGNGDFNSQKGIAYVIFGNNGSFVDIDLSSFRTGDRGVIITATETMTLLGSSVAAAGDINGDLLDDIIVSAPYARNSVGTVFVIYGKTSFATDIQVGSNFATSGNGVLIVGSGTYEQLGDSESWALYGVSTLNDINGDSYADIAVIGPGVVYVIYGSLTLPSQFDLVTPLSYGVGMRIIGDILTDIRAPRIRHE